MGVVFWCVCVVCVCVRVCVCCVCVLCACMCVCCVCVCVCVCVCCDVYGVSFLWMCWVFFIDSCEAPNLFNFSNSCNWQDCRDGGGIFKETLTAHSLLLWLIVQYKVYCIYVYIYIVPCHPGQRSPSNWLPLSARLPGQAVQLCCSGVSELHT